MLTEEKILKNAKKFNDSGVKYNVINDELMTLLGEEFIKAPCTTSTNFYNAYDGGLIQHILNVTKNAIATNSALPEAKQVDQASLIRVCLIHQIGKVGMFVEQTSKWHQENKGEMYKWNEDSLSLGTAERSVFYALKSGIALTEDEVYAIYNFNSDFASKPMTKAGEKLAAILKVANMISVIEEK